jgi:hypothetical protein
MQTYDADSNDGQIQLRSLRVEFDREGHGHERRDHERSVVRALGEREVVLAVARSTSIPTHVSFYVT